MDKTNYQEKCLALLNTNQFVKLNRDPTKQIKTKIQRVLRKNKTNISLQEYLHLYPTGSSPGKLYGTSKILKLSPTDNTEKLSIRSIVSNINTPTYQLAKQKLNLSIRNFCHLYINQTTQLIVQNILLNRSNIIKFQKGTKWCHLTWNHGLQVYR